MANNGGRVGIRQQQSRTPQFIFVALGIVICILGFNYWYLSGEHNTLRTRTLEVQSKYNALLRRRNDMERRNAALRSELSRSESLYLKTKKLAETKTQELLDRQSEAHNSLGRIAGLQSEIQSCKGKLEECKETGDRMQHMISNSKRQGKDSLSKMDEKYPGAGGVTATSTTTDDLCKKQLFELRNVILSQVAKYHGADAAKKIESDVKETDNLRQKSEDTKKAEEKRDTADKKDDNENKDENKNQGTDDKKNNVDLPKKDTKKVDKTLPEKTDQYKDENKKNTNQENKREFENKDTGKTRNADQKKDETKGDMKKDETNRDNEDDNKHEADKKDEFVEVTTNLNKTSSVGEKKLDTIESKNAATIKPGFNAGPNKIQGVSKNVLKGQTMEDKLGNKKDTNQLPDQDENNEDKKNIKKEREFKKIDYEDPDPTVKKGIDKPIQGDNKPLQGDNKPIQGEKDTDVKSQLAEGPDFPQLKKLGRKGKSSKDELHNDLQINKQDMPVKNRMQLDKMKLDSRIAEINAINEIRKASHLIKQE